VNKKKKLINNTMYRKTYVNIIWCLVFVLGILIIPTFINFGLKYIIHNKYICSLLSNIIFISIMVIVYYRDLKDEFKIFKRKFKDNIKLCLKYYIIGMILMIGFNIILSSILGGIALNESQVRDVLFNHTTYMLINIVLIAPITEELVYRKSIFTVIKSKWFYATISGLLFGGAHILTNIISGGFVATDLLYILPYGSFGFMFAVMDYETDTVYSSIIMHSIHNLLNGLLLINLHMLGVL